MTISWGSALTTKYLTFLFGKEWDKEDFKLIGFKKTPLGWNSNIWRFCLTYDNFGKVEGNKNGRV